MLLCLSNEDNDVSGTVTEFCHQYVLLLKQLPQLGEQQRELVKQLMFVVLNKYRLPDDYDHEREGENEALFLEYRKEVKLIITNLGMLDSNLLVATIDSLVTDTLRNWQSRSHQVIELALSLVYIVGEALTINPGNLCASTDEKAIKLKNMILLVVASGVSQSRHIAVNLEYFEIICRYDKLFATETQAIPEVLASFLDDRGVRHSSKRLRSRVVYLFARFVKAQKSVLHEHVETVLAQLADLLAVNPQVDQDRLITAEDQMFLYEATGTLIVFGNFVPEKKKIYMEQLLGGLVGKFMDCLAALPTISDPEQKKLVVEFLNNIMAYTSRTTKAFSNQLSMQNCLCSGVFVQLMATFLNAVTPENNALLDGLRQYLHRMVVCLEDEMLPYLPEIISKFLSVANDLKALQDFLILMQQLLAKYKSNIVPHMQGQMPQLFATFFAVLDAPHDLSDETVSRDLTYMKRAYLQMLNASVTHDALDLWTAGGADMLQKLIASLVGFCLQPQDHTTQRQSFGTIQKLIAVVGKAEKAHHRSWVDELLWKQTVVACFQAPTMEGFDLTDAQCALVLHEIAQCFRQIFALKGDEFVSFVVGNCLNGLPQQRIDEFIQLTKNSDGKQLQKYLKKFFVELRQLRPSS
uniref:Exportin-T n=1 Tax=Plectus sambesii TaxID=2011161 RepID=A0A914XTS0_9BILA